MPLTLPSPTARGSMVDLLAQWEDGQGALITFATDDNVELYEIEVQPPAVDTGDAINCTTHHNTAWRTMAPPKLKELGSVTATVSFNKNHWAQIVLGLVGVKDTITVTYSDGSTLAFYGFLKSFTPQNFVDGEKPTAEIEIVATNRDTDGNEAAPQYAAA